MTLSVNLAADDDFALVTGRSTMRLTAGLLAFLATDVVSAIATLFWL
jgi:hypothetical protein